MTNPVMSVHTQHRMDGDQRVELGRACWFWCPGCDMQHMVNVIGEDGSAASVTWDWDGSVEAPTFSPSILLTGGSKDVRCHSFIRSGRWEFLGDCSHSLAGQTVDMVPLPDWLVHPETNSNTPEN